MTNQKSMQCSSGVLDAAYAVIHDFPGGSQALAPQIGKSATSLSHEATATGSAKLGLETAVNVTDLSGDMRILQAWAAHSGHLLMPMAPSDATLTKGCLEGLTASAKEFSDLVLVVTGGMSDNAISDNELSQIVNEGSQLISCVYALISAARAKNKTDTQHWGSTQ